MIFKEIRTFDGHAEAVRLPLNCEVALRNFVYLLLCFGIFGWAVKQQIKLKRSNGAHHIFPIY